VQKKIEIFIKPNSYIFFFGTKPNSYLMYKWKHIYFISKNLTSTMHNICQVRDSNPDHHKKKIKKNWFRQN